MLYHNVRMKDRVSKVVLKSLFLFGLALILIIGCANENKDWQKAQADGTIEGYETFIRKHPNSQFSQKALEEVWRLTKEKNTIDAYEEFLNNHPGSSFSNIAKENIKTIWTSLVPEKPRFEILSNMTVDLDWTEVPGAQYYVIYWSSQRHFKKDKVSSATTQWTSFNHKFRRGKYGARLPMYYRITAVKDSMESKLSDACLAKLLPHKGGRFCQLCGNKSIGYCHLRDNIYVCSDHNTFEDDEGINWRCP